MDRRHHGWQNAILEIAARSNREGGPPAERFKRAMADMEEVLGPNPNSPDVVAAQLGWNVPPEVVAKLSEYQMRTRRMIMGTSDQSDKVMGFSKPPLGTSSDEKKEQWAEKYVQTLAGNPITQIGHVVAMAEMAEKFFVLVAIWEMKKFARLPNGARVCIQELKKATHLNGKSGTVTGFDESAKRYVVLVDDARRKVRVKQENLVMGTEAARDTMMKLIPLGAHGQMQPTHVLVPHGSKGVTVLTSNVLTKPSSCNATKAAEKVKIHNLVGKETFATIMEDAKPSWRINSTEDDKWWYSSLEFKARLQSGDTQWMPAEHLELTVPVRSLAVRN